jgi:NADH-quinone oxidoreductase subunit I
MIFGTGVLRGMVVTMKNMVASYFKKADDGGLFTVEYPERRLPAIENFRNFPVLIYDGAPENIRCTACDICAKECPPKCITVVRETGPDGKPLKKPAVFDIDYAICMNCGMCEEVCPFDSIFMDHDFEIAEPLGREKLLRHKEELSRSNEYLHKIRPQLARAIDAKRKEAEEKKKAAAQAAAGKKSGESTT